MFRRSSAVEQLTVNQLVVGSIPTAGAKIPKQNSRLQMAPSWRLRCFSALVTGFVTELRGRKAKLARRADGVSVIGSTRIKMWGKREVG